MTITVTTYGVEDTTNVADVDVLQIASSEWSERKGAFIATNGTVGVVYVNNTTPINSEMTLVSSVRTAPREGDAGVRHVTVKISTKVAVENSVSGDILYYPLAASFGLDIPMIGDLTVTHLSHLAQNMFAVLFPTASSGVIATTGLAKLLSGVPNIY